MCWRCAPSRRNSGCLDENWAGEARLAGCLCDFPQYARVHAVFLMLEPRTIDNGLITLTMKLKRIMIERSFAEEIGQLYTEYAMNKVATVITPL